MRSEATPNWPWPPVCFLYLPSASAWLGDGLPVGDADVLGLHLDAELAVQPLGGDGQVGLARAPQDGLVGLVDPLDHQGRVLVLQAVQAVMSLSSSPLDLGRMATDRADRLGLGAGHDDRVCPWGPGCRPVAVSASLGTATMSPAWASVDRVGLLAPQQLQDVELARRRGCGGW